MVRKSQEIKTMSKLLSTGKSVNVKGRREHRNERNGQDGKRLETESQAHLRFEA